MVCLVTFAHVQRSYVVGAGPVVEHFDVFEGRVAGVTDGDGVLDNVAGTDRTCSVRGLCDQERGVVDGHLNIVSSLTSVGVVHGIGQIIGAPNARIEYWICYVGGRKICRTISRPVVSVRWRAAQRRSIELQIYALAGFCRIGHDVGGGIGEYGYFTSFRVVSAIYISYRQVHSVVSGAWIVIRGILFAA